MNVRSAVMVIKLVLIAAITLCVAYSACGLVTYASKKLMKTEYKKVWAVIPVQNSADGLEAITLAMSFSDIRGVILLDCGLDGEGHRRCELAQKDGKVMLCDEKNLFETINKNNK